MNTHKSVQKTAHADIPLGGGRSVFGVIAFVYAASQDMAEAQRRKEGNKERNEPAEKGKTTTKQENKETQASGTEKGQSNDLRR